MHRDEIASSSDGANAPKVSVCCAWYNRADYVRDTVDSLLAQDLDSFEIVLVNDGSPDPRVREILDSYDDPRLKVIHQENTGFTRAIIRAIAESSGPYIAIMGAGDTCDRTRLRKQYEWLSTHPDCAIVGCHFDQYYISENRRETHRPRENPSGRISHFTFSHGELMYRKEAYEEAGGYRPIFTVGQGSDLWMRMLRSHSSHIIPEKLYTQVIFEDGVTKSPEKRHLRGLLNRLRVDNELLYRRSGIDLIEKHGFHAPLFMNNNLLFRAAKMVSRRIQRQIHERPQRNPRV
jgi:glycosyltransferase involved in cell wall biosynthesis